jgi:CheY-like chemotaxis protein
MQGGRIAAHSEGVGRGSEFTVRLPLVAAASRAAPLRHEAERASTVKFPAHRILVVDDAPAAAQMLAKLLEKLGQEVRTAHSAAEALELVRASPPQVVISDLGMPHVDGLELARRLRAIPAMRAAMLVALTGYGQESDKERTKDAGFNQHLVKPVSLEARPRQASNLPSRRAVYSAVKSADVTPVGNSASKMASIISAYVIAGASGSGSGG